MSLREWLIFCFALGLGGIIESGRLNAIKYLDKKIATKEPKG